MRAVLNLAERQRMPLGEALNMSMEELTLWMAWERYKESEERKEAQKKRTRENAGRLVRPSRPIRRR